MCLVHPNEPGRNDQLGLGVRVRFRFRERIRVRVRVTIRLGFQSPGLSMIHRVFVSNHILEPKLKP